MIPAETLPRKSRLATLLEHFAVVEDPRDVRRIPRPEPGGAAILEMEVVSTARLLTIPNGRRKSDAAQRNRDPADRFRRYKAVARTIDVPWGEKDARR